MLSAPLNAVMWAIGSMAALLLGLKSRKRYRVHPDPFTYYLSWFGVLAAAGMFMLGVPALVSRDLGVLRLAYLIGELFVVSSFVAQSGIVWYFLLNQSIKYVWVAFLVGVSGLVAVALSFQSATLKIIDNFIIYSEPLASTIIIGTLALCVFLPIGYYFLRVSFRQSGLPRIKSTALGLVYSIIGLSCGLNEYIYQVVVTPPAAYLNMVFFVVLFIALLWPKGLYKEQ